MRRVSWLTPSIVVLLLVALPLAVAAQGEGGQERLPVPDSGLSATVLLKSTTGVFLKDPLQAPNGGVDFGVGLFNQATGQSFSNPYGPPPDKKELSVFRNEVQLDLEWKSHYGRAEFFGRLSGAYEPNYAYEKTNPIANDFWKEASIRDFFVAYHASPRWTLSLGRQIVTWGEALTARINDVINPQDFSFSFGFLDLEATRLPIFMLRSYLTVPRTGTTWEVIAAPGWDPLFSHYNFSDGRYAGQRSVAGRINNFAPVGGRFGATYAHDGFAGLFVNNVLTSEFNIVLDGLGLPPAPMPIQLQIPDATLDNLQYGTRAVQDVGHGWQLSGFYWHSHQYSPVIDISPSGTFLFTYPEEDSLGVGLNGVIPSKVPLVLRTEVNYTPDQTFNVAIPGLPGVPGVGEQDHLKYLFAIDLTQLRVPWLTRTGSLSVTMEHVGDIVDDGNALLLQRDDFTRIWVLSALTSWYWDAVGLTLAAQYEENAGNLAWFPSVSFTPPSNKNLTFKLQWVGFSLDTPGEPYGAGIFEDKDFTTFQVVWSLPTVHSRR